MERLSWWAFSLISAATSGAPPTPGEAHVNQTNNDVAAEQPTTVFLSKAEVLRRIAGRYFTPRPGETRHYPCVDYHCTVVIPDNPALRQGSSTEAPEQNNENSQSFSHSASN